MSRGNKVVLTYAPQTDVAVKPTTGWKTLPRKSDSLNHTVELTDSETIKGLPLFIYFIWQAEVVGILVVCLPYRYPYVCRIFQKFWRFILCLPAVNWLIIACLPLMKFGLMGGESRRIICNYINFTLQCLKIKIR